MDANQRAFFRIDATVPTVVRRLDLTGSGWDEFSGETVDVSAGGVLLTAPEFLPAGHCVELAFRCAAPPLDLTVTACVVRSWRTVGGAWLSAMRFEDLAPQAERDLVRFCFLKERETAERVSNVRIDLAISVRLVCRDRAVHQATTENVCADGARVRTTWDADLHEEVTVVFDERWFGRELAMQAHVRRRDEHGVDLEFSTTRADRAAINQLVMAEERRRRVA
jgi:hypothetical protein